VITICDHKPRGRQGSAISQDRISIKDIQNLLYSRRLKRDYVSLGFVFCVSSVLVKRLAEKCILEMAYFVFEWDVQHSPNQSTLYDHEICHWYIVIVCAAYCNYTVLCRMQV